MGLLRSTVSALDSYFRRAARAGRQRVSPTRPAPHVRIAPDLVPAIVERGQYVDAIAEFLSHAPDGPWAVEGHRSSSARESWVLWLEGPHSVFIETIPPAKQTVQNVVRLVVSAVIARGAVPASVAGWAKLSSPSPFEGAEPNQRRPEPKGS